MQQRISRAHRIGRKEIVISKRYIMKNSIEENILKLKSSKKELVDFLLDDKQMQSMTLDDLTCLITR